MSAIDTRDGDVPATDGGEIPTEVVPDVGDRVTVVDDFGQLHEGIVVSSCGATIDALYNDSRADGVFEDRGDDRYDVATSLEPAKELDEPHSYIEGGWGVSHS